MSNAVAFEHAEKDGTVVSILASKSTNKYRLQSDSLAALALPITELQRRLLLALPDLKISLDSTPPVVELWALVELHYAAQTELQNETVGSDTECCCLLINLSCFIVTDEIEPSNSAVPGRPARVS